MGSCVTVVCRVKDPICRPDASVLVCVSALHCSSMCLHRVGDVEALITGAKYIRVLVPAAVNVVYKKLQQYNITQRAFETRYTSYKGPGNPNLSETSPQILHRKMFLRDDLSKLCTTRARCGLGKRTRRKHSVNGDANLIRVDKVGMMHVDRAAGNHYT
jgi:hypothetical protein